MTAWNAAARVAPGLNAHDEFARRFSAAVRHSRLVGALRVGIPAIAGMAALALLALWLNPFRAPASGPVRNAQSTAISGSKIVMELPRLAGFTRDSRAYEFNARSAAQDVSAPNLVELTEIRGTLEMQDKTRVELVAPTGIFDSKGERLTLGKNIVIRSSAGHEGRLHDAVVDVRTGQIVSESAVEVRMLDGTLNANRLEMERNGEVIRFGGGVSMTLKLSTPAPPGAARP